MHNQILKHCLLFALSIIFYLGAYSQIGYKQWRNDIISEVNEEQQNVIHCLPRSLNGCNYIDNNTFLPNELYQSSNILHYHNPFNFDPEMIPGWYASHGTPNISDGVNYPSPLPFTDAGYARMGAWGDDFSDDLLSEGIVQKIPVLTANKEYVLSFFKKIENIAAGAGNTIDNFNIVLMNCADYSQIYTPLYEVPQLPANSQVIYCERLVRNVNWEQVVIRFTASQAYDMIWVFPKQNIGASSVPSVILFSFPELIDPTNFSAGIPPATGNCHVTIGPAPLNCSVRNTVFTWRDPSNNIVYQGPNQLLNLDMGTAPSGTYTLSMSVPSAANITTNGCSLQFPVYSATVNVPPPTCDCTGLQIVLPWIKYDNTQHGDHYVQNLITCQENKLCFNGNELIEFFASSSHPSGNTWEVFITQYQGGWIEFNGDWMPPPNTNPVSTNSTANINFLLDPLAYGLVEIRLTNSILNQVTSVFFRIVPKSTVWDICYSISNPGYKKMISSGGEVPGHSYTWTFPAGINVINTNVLSAEFNDASYTGPIPATAVLQITNTLGCPSYSQNVVYYPNVAPYCNARNWSWGVANKMSNDSLLRVKKESIIIFPNPTGSIINISSDGSFNKAIILNSEGKLMKEFSIYTRMQLVDISSFANGVYLVVLKKKDGSSEALRIVKH